MAGSRSACFGGEGKKRGRKGGSGLWRSLAPQLGGTWPASYNFRADLEQLVRVQPLPPPSTSRKWWGVRRWPRILYLQKPTLLAHYTIPGSLQPDEAMSHQLKSFRPCSWPLDSWAALLGIGVSWAGGQSPRGGAMDKSEECVGLWAVASEKVDIYPGLGAGRSRPA